MVNDDQQRVFVAEEAIQARAHQRRARQVERFDSALAHPARELRVPDVDGNVRQVLGRQRDRRVVDHALARLAFVVDERSAQRVVALDQRLQAALQRLGVHPAQPRRQGDVPRPIGTGQLVEEPQRFLGEGQRGGRVVVVGVLERRQALVGRRGLLRRGSARQPLREQLAPLRRAGGAVVIGGEVFGFAFTVLPVL